ncbi:hypothetical protein QYS36_16190 [Pseudomonas sp. G34]|nr:hypothetical protein [Pseudomonas sp. G34]MDQ7986480.1 hypothetical protein [Pseudomonas sp. G34]
MFDLALDHLLGCQLNGRHGISYGFVELGACRSESDLRASPLEKRYPCQALQRSDVSAHCALSDTQRRACSGEISIPTRRSQYSDGHHWYVRFFYHDFYSSLHCVKRVLAEF